MLSGIDKEVSALGAGFAWVAIHSVGDIEVRLKTAAKHFGEFMLNALTPTSAKLAKMGMEIAGQAAANVLGGTLGDVMGAAVTGQKFDLGESMNRQADENSRRAAQSFTGAAALTGQAATQPKFEVKDIVGAAAVQARANEAFAGAVHSARHLFGLSPEGGGGTGHAAENSIRDGGQDRPSGSEARSLFNNPGMQWGRMIGYFGVHPDAAGLHYENSDRYADISSPATIFTNAAAAPPINSPIVAALTAPAPETFDATLGRVIAAVKTRNDDIDAGKVRGRLGKTADPKDELNTVRSF